MCIKIRDGFKAVCLSISKEVTHAACMNNRAEIPPFIGLVQMICLAHLAQQVQDVLKRQ